jgi:hypothetical protein
LFVLISYNNWKYKLTSLDFGDTNISVKPVDPIPAFGGPRATATVVPFKSGPCKGLRAYNKAMLAELTEGTMERSVKEKGKVVSVLN